MSIDADIKLSISPSCQTVNSSTSHQSLKLIHWKPIELFSWQFVSWLISNLELIYIKSLSQVVFCKYFLGSFRKITSKVAKSVVTSVVTRRLLKPWPRPYSIIRTGLPLPRPASTSSHQAVLY